MLVLSRKPGESIIVGQATITALDWNTVRSRIGIEAPSGCKVFRAELLGRAGEMLPPEDRRTDAILRRLRMMPEAKREGLIHLIVKEFCGSLRRQLVESR